MRLTSMPGTESQELNTCAIRQFPILHRKSLKDNPQSIQSIAAPAFNNPNGCKSDVSGL